MRILEIYVTQRKLRHPSQIVEMMLNRESLPPIILVELEDGTVEIHDGHHRMVTYWLLGRERLKKGEYLLLQLDRSHKRRFGRIEDLWGRMEDDLQVTVD